jgi:alpha-N-arabinofuranosidase
MRDALVAGINLNLFNKHCDRVKMANIAQLVNVLQALILTDGEKMLLTPTYHVFDMYQCHQDGELLDSYLETKKIGIEEDFQVPNLSESVSLGKDGRIHITMGNLSVDEAYEIEVCLTGKTESARLQGVSGTILTGEMQAHNTFEHPNRVHTREFREVTPVQGGFTFTIPPCSVLHLAVDSRNS